MNKILLITCVVVSFIASSQESSTLVSQKSSKKTSMFLNEDGKIIYTNTVEINGKDQKKLYLDAKEYILLNNTDKGFPTILDDNNDRVYFKNSFIVPHRKYMFPIFFNNTDWNLVYTTKLYFKDGKYKYEVTDLFVWIKKKARINGMYWGYGISSATITEAQVIKKDLEKIYKVKRYRGRWSRIIYKTDKGIKSEIEKFEKYMNKENDLKKW